MDLSDPLYIRNLMVSPSRVIASFKASRIYDASFPSCRTIDYTGVVLPAQAKASGSESYQHPIRFISSIMMGLAWSYRAVGRMMMLDPVSKNTEKLSISSKTVPQILIPNSFKCHYSPLGVTLNYSLVNFSGI
jgi:hypothetical protein